MPSPSTAIIASGNSGRYLFAVIMYTPSCRPMKLQQLKFAINSRRTEPGSCGVCKLSGRAERFGQQKDGAITSIPTTISNRS